MKILHCSDLHADWKSAHVSRTEDARDAMRQAVDRAIDERVDLFAFTGDLADPEDGARALRALAIALDAATRLLAAPRPIPSWWVAGNHDVVDDGSGDSVLTPLSMLGDPRVRVFDHPARTLLPGKPRVSAGAPAQAIVLPYPSLANAYDPKAYVLDARRSAPAQVVVLTHLQVDGATPGDETTDMARGRDVFFPFEECDERWLLIGGHYHQAQTLERAGRELHVVGSMLRLNHGEEKARPQYRIWEV
jgi:DNA repair exonuclease SbcCD nuclease subunit